MEFALVPTAKIVMNMRKKIAAGVFIFTAILWLTLSFCAVFSDIATFFVLTSLLIIFNTLFLYPYVRYGRISQSNVKFTSDSVQFVDLKGVCWRSISYTSILKMQKRTIYGTFYGENKHEVEGIYICFFLNVMDDVPNVPYHRLFLHKDFAMVSYHEELFAYLENFLPFDI